MGKRKNRQPDVVDDANESNPIRLSESSEEASLGEFKCPHQSKALKLSMLRKRLKNKLDTTCHKCKSTNSNVNEEHDEEGFAIETPKLWICLSCGNQACGRDLGRHAEEHFKTPRSDNHCLAMDIHHWKIYCYECDEFINVDNNKQLSEIVEMIKKSTIKTSNSSQPAIPLPSIDSISSDIQLSNNITDKQSLNHLTKVGGLINNGNTCFFNSVLQCLAQTPYLVKVLENLREPGETFLLPGGTIKVSSENNDEIIEKTLPSIAGSLEGWGTFTSILCKTLIEMQNSTDNKSHRPLELLSSFKKKTSQCMDGGQHDSHELLRHLLELVREEDLRGFRSIILKETGLKHTSRKIADATEKATIKCYGNQASARLLGAEPVFRGELVSTLKCLECNHSSQRNEPFMDLSLPVMIDKHQLSIIKRKNFTENNDLNIVNVKIPSNPPLSKHQLKKEKKSARKNRKHHKHHNSIQNSNNEESLLSNNSISEENHESNADETISEPDDESDADVEDNTEGETAPIPDVIESECSSEKLTQPSPTEPTAASPLNGSSLKTTFSEAETDECRSSPETEYPNRESSVTSNTVNNINEVATELSKISVTNDKTLDSSSPRYPIVEGDFSIQSCLNQFTDLELMTDSNRVGCEACTARENKKNGSNNNSSKMICTPSTKQYLISRVPPVLILHLKRFQSQRYGGVRKVTKRVTFPMILDLAPVCKNHEKPILYSLFGLVEHSGTLYSGHYVAYIKARRPLDPNDYRWSFLPKRSTIDSDETKSSDGSDIKVEVDQDPKTTVEPPPGQWYYASDSRVVAVNEAAVLNAEAYLLFYERIL
ncbi:hypothetical protein PV327_003955 [Microctonus hyperodae]|uniref:Ubiquitin carboxyl-terminal hydrolase n=1 Tax=Microctonus hyperodae TaxID=165561 RepID=A0AA39L1L1_MICHY|nr:hypothetical protein PV327_003955 [Microctonus hyperodae]